MDGGRFLAVGEGELDGEESVPQKDASHEVWGPGAQSCGWVHGEAPWDVQVHLRSLRCGLSILSRKKKVTKELLADCS